MPTDLSFKYPATFDSKEDKLVENANYPKKIFATNFFDGKTLFSVAVYENTYNYSLDMIVDSVFMKYTSTPLTNRKPRKITLGHQKAIILESLQINEHLQTPIYLSAPFTDVFIIRKNYIYRFELSKDNVAESKVIFNQILNTISFTNK